MDTDVYPEVKSRSRRRRSPQALSTRATAISVPDGDVPAATFGSHARPGKHAVSPRKSTGKSSLKKVDSTTSGVATPSLHTPSATPISIAPQRVPTPRVTHTRPARKPPSTPPECRLAAYKEHVEDGTAGMLQIDPRTWIAEIIDDDCGDTAGGIAPWSHIICDVGDGFDLKYTCTECVEFERWSASCVHTELLRTERPLSSPFSFTDDPECVLFRHGALGPYTQEFVSLFSCLVSGAKKRVIVSLRKYPGRAGLWQCNAHSDHNCQHVQLAKKHLKALEVHAAECKENSALARRSAAGDGGEDIDLEDIDLDGEDSDGDVDTNLVLLQLEQIDCRASSEEERERSISYKPIAPPQWASLPSDQLPNNRAPADCNLPLVFEIGPDAKCRCGSPAKPGALPRLLKCTVFTINCAYQRLIQVLPCSQCRPELQHYVGPDLGDFGIFNFNNRRLYTHTLMNEYTSRYTCSETPFNAFCKAMSRTYIDHNSPVSFNREDGFRDAWFSFMRIQELDDSFTCELCGPNPRVIIADGCSAGFQRKRATRSLHPPTCTDGSSPLRQSVEPTPNMMLVPEPVRLPALRAVKWRCQLRKGVTPLRRASTIDPEKAVDLDVNESAAKAQEKTRVKKRDEADRDMLHSLPGLTAQLMAVHPALGKFFQRFTTPEPQLPERIATRYLELLQQLLAYESVLQFAPERSWPLLDLLCKEERNSLDIALKLLPIIPAIGKIARWEAQNSTESTPVCSLDLRLLCGWIADRASATFKRLSGHPVEPATASTGGPGCGSDAWRLTGACYAQPPLRTRPVYPRLPHDNRVERNVVSSMEGIGCPKHYQEYGAKGLTGGLMALWCPHSVCLGFHCIPKGEGRNDVFSAILCHFEKAPEILVYDFACALAPYCMTREPSFFKDTLFVIDDFHTEGHIRCSSACFLKNYAAHDAELLAINSSAAECGNSGILRIRKSLRYMSQAHSIVYVRTFLAVWNRVRRCKMASVGLSAAPH